MSLPLTALVALARACAPAVAPNTLVSLAWTESAFDPLAIGVNTPAHRAVHPADLSEALREARRLQAQGASFDLGLAQINARNLAGLGLSLRDAFDPCRNLGAAGRLLTANYLRARARSASSQDALVAALSLYNTGDADRGLRNGYVGRVFRAAARWTDASPPRPWEVAPWTAAARPAPRPASAPPALDVFAAPSPALVAWTPQDAATPPFEPLHLSGARS